MTTVSWVWNTRFMPATTSWPSAANSGPRWSIVGIAMACNTRSGTLVGPGICKKWRPVCPAAVFFITAGSLLLDTRVWARNAIPTRQAIARSERTDPGARPRPPVSAGNLQAFPFPDPSRHYRQHQALVSDYNANAADLAPA